MDPAVAAETNSLGVEIPKKYIGNKKLQTIVFLRSDLGSLFPPRERKDTKSSKHTEYHPGTRAISHTQSHRDHQTLLPESKNNFLSHQEQRSGPRWRRRGSRGLRRTRTSAVARPAPSTSELVLATRPPEHEARARPTSTERGRKDGKGGRVGVSAWAGACSGGCGR